MSSTSTYEDLFNTLVRDVRAANDEILVGDPQYKRRAFVRALFALIEGETFIRKQVALLLSPDFRYRLTSAELALLREHQYRLKRSGEPEVQSHFLRTADNVLFSFKIVAKICGSQPAIDPSHSEWSRFLKAVEVRNRITHPKAPDDLTVSDEDLKTMRDTLDWYTAASLAAFDPIRNKMAGKRDDAT